MAKRKWWQKPQLRTDEDEKRHRRVTWLELFFDLVFVVVVARLAHELAGNVSSAGVRDFVFLFIPVWWVWIGVTFYTERFETEGLESRLFVFLMMLPVSGLAVFAHDGLGNNFEGFAISYAIARIFITLMWFRSGLHVREFRPVSSRYVSGFSSSIVLVITSIFLQPPLRFVVWAAALTIDICTPIITIKHQMKLPRLSTSRLPERFGLFTIIVLGESIAGVANAMADMHSIHANVLVCGVLGIAIGFSLWWVYFDFIGRRVFKQGLWWSLSWSYLHLVLVMGITATGAGVYNLVALSSGLLPDNLRLLVAGSVGTSLAALALLETTLERDRDEPIHRIISPALKLVPAAAAIFIGIFGRGLEAVAVLAIMAAIISIPVLHGVHVWFSQDIPNR